MVRTAIDPFAAVDRTPLTAEPSEYFRLMMRSDTCTSASLMPLARSISNQNNLRRLEDDRYDVPDVTRL